MKFPKEMLLQVQSLPVVEKMKFFWLIFGCLGSAYAAKVQLRDLIPICDAKSPQLNACVVNSANKLIPILSKGIKSYGFPPLDPLYVSEMNIGQNSGPVSLQLLLQNTTHLGLSTIRFHYASIDTTRNRWALNGTLFDYSVEGKYKGNGRILLVPIRGDGKAHISFKNVSIDFIIQGVPKKEKENVYFSITNLRVYFIFRQSYVSFTNLFNGNKQLGEATNRFLNENSGEVVSSLKGTLEDIYSALYKNLLKRIFSSVPYNQVFNNV